MRTCMDREPDLLLLGLGELGPIRRAATRLHLRHCDACRTRQLELAATSRQIASVLMPNSGGPSTGGPSRGRPAWTPLLVALTVSLLLVTGSLYWLVRGPSAARASTSVSAAETCNHAR